MLELPAGAQQVQVLDALGRPVRLMRLPTELTSCALDMRGQPVGLYLVQVLMRGGQVATCRLVRQ